MGIEMFSYLKSNLLYNNTHEEEVLHHRKIGPNEKEDKKIVRSNLEIYAHTVSRKHESLVAKTMPQLQHCHYIISSMQGVGIGEYMPSKKLVEEAGGVIRRPLVEGDTVISVFIDPCCGDTEGTKFPTDVAHTYHWEKTEIHAPIYEVDIQPLKPPLQNEHQIPAYNCRI